MEPSNRDQFWARRVKKIESQICSGSDVPTDVASLPLPPLFVPENEVFPSFPEMLKRSKQAGGVVSYQILGGRRITIITDPELFPVVFSPDEMGSTPGVDDAVKVEMDKLAHAWFGIPKGIVSHTKKSLAAVRKCIGPSAVLPIVYQVGHGVKQRFDKLGQEGVIDLVDVAHSTFWPVNKAFFGEDTINEEIAPNAIKWFHDFDENIPQVAGGMPAKLFEEMQDARKKIVNMFEASIGKGNHLKRDKCPVLHDRFEPISEEEMNSYSLEAKASFMVSIFWAPQANTLPMTWWTLVHILADPKIKAKVETESRGERFGSNAPRTDGSWPFDEDDLPYINACVKEVLRMYIANLTHRHVSRDIPVKTGDRWLRIPHHDMLSVASYTRHYDPLIFKDPHRYWPERWLGEEKHSLKDFWPFAMGKYSCSGKFLAMGEIPLLVAMFFRDFDTKLMDPVPEADWVRVVASVRPVGWPYNTNCRVRYIRRS